MINNIISKFMSLKGIDRNNYFYIIVNVAVSFFSFLRSFIFMRVLDLKELGVISLVQTIFMFMGLLQFGLLNGGYRIVSLGKGSEIEKTNNAIFSYLAILLPFGLLFCFLSDKFNWIEDLSLSLLLISVVFGIFTLLNNWMHNVLVGEQKLREVNYINIWSYLASVLSFPLAFIFGFWGAMLVIMVQPLVFVLMVIYRNTELRPTGFNIDSHYFKYILSFGFIPFLGGIFAAIYLQVERWSIASVLGVESLGGFYLVFLYVSLFQLIPNSINSIFFPKGVKAYSEKRYLAFNKIIKLYFLALVCYDLIITLITFLLLEPFVSLLLPKHISGLTLVYVILPGLVLQSLSEPVGLILNSSVILKPMLYINSLNLLFTITGIFFMIFSSFFTLYNLAVLRSLSGLLMMLAYSVLYFTIKKKLYVT